MATKDNRPKARLPRGFADRSAAEIRATERMMATIRAVYERYGFEPVETPLVEFTEALGKFLPDQDRPNEGVFSFQDDDAQEARSAGRGEERSDRDQEIRTTGKKGDWLSLRYDLTAPLARYVAENYEKLPKPYRSYRAGWVFRNEKPGPGRFRQFMQFDADTVGAASPAADAEMCMMMADIMEALGIKRGDYVIKVNSRKVLDGLLEGIGVVEERQNLMVLRAVDKLDRLGVVGVRELLGTGRKDESGDFTKGAGLSDSQIYNIVELLMSGSPLRQVVDERGEILGDLKEMDRESLPPNSLVGPSNWTTLKSLERLSRNARFQEGLHDLAAISTLTNDVGYGWSEVRVDTSVVRGLEYYTGAVFEAELHAEIPNEQGQPVVFGSVGGGGRYDGLIGRFRGEDVPATGFSIGVSRLQAALAALGKLDGADAAGPVVVLVMDRARIGDYQAMVSRLRVAGISAELYLGDSGMKAQMKYADRRNAPLAIIQGGDEKARNVIQIKDLVEGKRLAGGMADHDAYREARPGQVEVAEDALVETVNKMLGRGERRP